MRMVGTRPRGGWARGHERSVHARGRAEHRQDSQVSRLDLPLRVQYVTNSTSCWHLTFWHRPTTSGNSVRGPARAPARTIEAHRGGDAHRVQSAGSPELVAAARKQQCWSWRSAALVDGKLCCWFALGVSASSVFGVELHWLRCLAGCRHAWLRPDHQLRAAFDAIRQDRPRPRAAVAAAPGATRATLALSCAASSRGRSARRCSRCLVTLHPHRRMKGLVGAADPAAGM